MTSACARVLLIMTLVGTGTPAVGSHGGVPLRRGPVAQESRQQPITITRHVSARDQADRYVYVPVTVPPGTTAMTIAYEYDTAGGTTVIDLGLFEPGPLSIGSRAFRGWSGGGRREVTIAVDEATPGYWPGPLPPGEWHVMLGLYKIAPAGVDVTVTARLSHQPRHASNPALVPRTSGPVRRGTGWYAGVVHAHTVESDGALTVTKLIEKARAEGLDFLSITDHNNTTHQRYPLDRPDLLVISGEEVTTPAGHYNVLGLTGARAFVDFRMQPGDPAIATSMEAIRRRGGLVSLNHPASDCLACSWTSSIPSAVDAIEIVNGQPVDRARAMAIWDMLLRSGRRVTAVEGRDWHRGTDPLAAPVLRVLANELSERAILEGIRHGRAIVMASAALPVPELRIESGGRTATVGETLAMARGDVVHVMVRASGDQYRGATVDWVWNGEAVARMRVDADGIARFGYHPAASGYGRIHVNRQDGTPLAISNPVYIDVRTRK
jgi:hypothetical protein